MMNIEGVTLRIIFRYICVQTLETIVFILILIFVHAWITIPVWVFASACAVWVLKDIILFPFVWRAYDWEGNQESDQMTRMVGMPGVVHDQLNPSGYIHVRGELWKAEVEDKAHHVDKGSAVTVVGTRGFTLVVRPGKQQE